MVNGYREYYLDIYIYQEIRGRKIHLNVTPRMNPLNIIGKRAA